MTTGAAVSIGFISGVGVSVAFYVLACVFAYYKEAFEKFELIYKEMQEDVENDPETIPREAKENGST